MIERRARPIGCCVADRTIQRETGQCVVRIRRTVIQPNMAGITILGRIREVGVVVALVALQRRVRPSERERRARMIERRTRPIGGAVANRAIHWEPGRYVVRVRRCLEKRKMARVAVGRCSNKYVVHMALRTLHCCMRAG